VSSRLAPAVMANPNQLKQVFLNIIVNARHAMSSGGTLTVTSRRTDEGEVEIALGDTGGGMSPEVARRIFDPFFTTKGDSGNGIGLFLCRNIVKDHGGVLTVSSRPGEGSTFIIRLPGARARETAGDPVGVAGDVAAGLARPADRGQAECGGTAPAV
jgi:signal transduction histidine kinase